MKAAIITLYHNNINCGGILQAYALYKYLENNGIDVEQITYEKRLNVADVRFGARLRRFLKNRPISAVKKIMNYFKMKLNYIPVDEEEMKARRTAFQHFMCEIIQHSDKIYNQDSVRECVNDYDVFITGSDQVWNFAWYDSVYFLDFVDGKQKKKFSYAASFSMKELTDAQKLIVSDSLKDYEAISVREQDAVSLLDGLTNRTVEYVVDPTLLLKQEEWNEVCAESVVDEEYVFGYFLGSNIDVVRKAVEFAHKRNFKFVMIPFASGNYNMKEDGLADIRIVDAAPEKFLSLIKNAQYVFTDSFHAVVFSFIYQKQFFVFNRDKKESMNSRIFSITELLGLEERFCNSKKKESLEYIEGLQEIDYTVPFEKFEELRARSVKFLEQIISN